MRFLAIISYTLRESLAKKTFIAFFVVITITHLLFLFALNVDLVSGGMAAVQLFGKDVEQEIEIEKLRKIIIGIESGLAIAMYGAGIFLSIFATASLVPNMLEKGSVDLLLSRPFALAIAARALSRRVEHRGDQRGVFDRRGVAYSLNEDGVLAHAVSRERGDHHSRFRRALRDHDVRRRDGAQLRRFYHCRLSRHLFQPAAVGA